MTGEGNGKFKKILLGTYVSFDFAANLSGEKTQYIQYLLRTKTKIFMITHGLKTVGNT